MRMFTGQLKGLVNKGWVQEPLISADTRKRPINLRAVFTHSFKLNKTECT